MYNNISFSLYTLHPTSLTTTWAKLSKHLPKKSTPNLTGLLPRQPFSHLIYEIDAIQHPYFFSSSNSTLDLPFPYNSIEILVIMTRCLSQQYQLAPISPEQIQLNLFTLLVIHLVSAQLQFQVAQYDICTLRLEIIQDRIPYVYYS